MASDSPETRGAFIPVDPVQGLSELAPGAPGDGVLAVGAELDHPIDTGTTPAGSYADQLRADWAADPDRQAAALQRVQGVRVKRRAAVRRRIAGYMSSAVADGLYAARQDRELGEDAAHASESVYDD